MHSITDRKKKCKTKKKTRKINQYIPTKGGEQMMELKKEGNNKNRIKQ